MKSVLIGCPACKYFAQKYNDLEQDTKKSIKRQNQINYLQESLNNFDKSLVPLVRDLALRVNWMDRFDYLDREEIIQGRNISNEGALCLIQHFGYRYDEESMYDYFRHLLKSMTIGRIEICNNQSHIKKELSRLFKLFDARIQLELDIANKEDRQAMDDYYLEDARDRINEDFNTSLLAGRFTQII